MDDGGVATDENELSVRFSEPAQEFVQLGPASPRSPRAAPA